ncbi:MAG: M23 family metallopeptidase [Patescibacteria group bacterium]|jgi:murein DD-endopeptidase MepM/ murein hydrolase activator NlpD
MANICEKRVNFLVLNERRRYDALAVSSQFSQFFVRCGLLVVRALVWAKASAFRFLRLFSVVFRPIAKVVMSVVFIPVYRLGFAFRRQATSWYGPAKNRVMFFLTNRAVMHVAIAAVVMSTAVINLSMDTVRAETLDAFNKSLAYAVVTQQDSPIVEEYADTDVASLRSGATSYLSSASLSVPLGAMDNDASSISSSASLAGGGALAVPIIASASASIAPREGIETYVVAEGDTISTIASRFGISVNTVLWANNLSVRSVLKLGQELTILQTSGVVHTVKSGDTLTKISSTYHAESSAILAANLLSDSSAIVVGQKLMIPGGTPPAVIPAKPTSSSIRNVFVPAPKTAGTAPVSSSSRMFWPSDAHYVVRGLSWYHTGVDLDCNGHANGTSTDDNYAAADGVVTFAGPRFSGPNGGYGNLVIIDHGNGLQTRYGHNYSLYVTTGQIVTAGTPIARCGSTGWSRHTSAF